MLTSPTTWPGRLMRLDWRGAGFVLLGLALGAGLIAAGKTIAVLQGELSTLAILLPFSYAFAAGMVATVNPCGVLVLPSMVAYHLSRAGVAQLSAWQRTQKAVTLSLMATLGFVALFGGIGLVIGAGGRSLVALFPLAGLLVGVALVGLGGWLALTGRGLDFLAARHPLGQVQLEDDLRSPFLFGIAYAVSSLCCTLPVFLVVAGSALATGGAVAAVAQFVSYALGMGTVLMVVILGAVFFQRAVKRSLRSLAPAVHGLAASLLLGVGLYVVNYWLASGGLFG